MMKFKNKSRNNSWQGNLSGEIVRSLNEKKKESFSKSLENLNKKNNLVHPCTVSVIPLYNNPDFIHCLMNICQ